MRYRFMEGKAVFLQFFKSMFSFEFSLNIHCKIRLGWRTQHWNLSIKGWFTWCLLSFVKIQSIDLTICHVLLCSTRTSYRCKQFGPINVRWFERRVVSQSYVMKNLVIYSKHCGVKNTGLTLYFNGLVVSTNISHGFQPLESSVCLTKLNLWPYFCQLEQMMFTTFQNEHVMNGNFAFY